MAGRAHGFTGRQSLPSSACLLTFDDGVLDHYLNAFRVLQQRNLSGLFFVMDRCESDEFILAHKIHFLLAKLGLARLREAIWEKLIPLQRERFTQAEKRYQLKYPPVSLDKRINLLKAVLQRDLSAEVNPLLSDLFETHVGSEKETARNYYLNTGQIDEMAAGGMYFGGHSRSHPWFDWIDAEARDDGDQSLGRLGGAIRAGAVGICLSIWRSVGGLAPDSCNNMGL